MKRTFNRKTLELHYDYGHFTISYRFLRILRESRTKFQEVTVVQHERLGKVLLLDEDIMTAQHDFSYGVVPLRLAQSMKANRILILGGGDHKVAKLMRKHGVTADILTVEIDEEVMNIYAKEFYDGCVNDDSRVVFCDAYEFVKRCDFNPDLVVDDMPFEAINGDGLMRHPKFAEYFPGATFVVQAESNLNHPFRKRLDAFTSKHPNSRIESHYVESYLEEWNYLIYEK